MFTTEFFYLLTAKIIIFFCIFVFAVRLLLPYIVFHPSEKLEWEPENFENIFFESDGLKLHGWFIPVNNSKGTVLFLHGNAGNISHRKDSIEIFTSLGLNVFIFDYRSYGQSEGKPTIAGVNTDAMSAFNWLRNVRYEKNIIIFGRSLGGAVAVDLLKNIDPKSIRGLILESTFSSLADMAGSFFAPIAKTFVSSEWQSSEVAKYIAEIPVLCLHSKEDEVVPYKLGVKLYENIANKNKKFVEIFGDHNNGFLYSKGYKNELKKFAGKILD